MRTIEASEVFEMVRGGAKLFIGRSSTGKLKLKLVRGPFGLFVSRYLIEENQCDILKTKLKNLKY